MESGQREDYRREAAAAAVIGVAAGIAAFVSGELAVGISATVTALASVAGWALGRLLTHDAHRLATAVVAATVSVFAVVLVVVGAGERCAPKGVTCLVGGCEPFNVHAQNRWLDYGAAVRAEPLAEAARVREYNPNQLITIDGWVRGGRPYQSNPAPFNSDIWFHLADDTGWVSFAAVRAESTTPTDLFDDDGGAPALAPEECRGSLRSNK